MACIQEPHRDPDRRPEQRRLRKRPRGRDRNKAQAQGKAMTIKQQHHTASPACRQQINVTITSLVLAKTHQTRQMTNSGRAFYCHARHRRSVCKGNLALLHLANNNISPRTGTPPLRHFLHHRAEPTAGTLAVANMRHYALRAMSPQSPARHAMSLGSCTCKAQVRQRRDARLRPQRLHT